MKMKSGFIIFILILIALTCYLIYDDLPSKYTKLEESFEGFMNKSLFMVLVTQARLILLNNT